MGLLKEVRLEERFSGLPWAGSTNPDFPNPFPLRVVSSQEVSPAGSLASIGMMVGAIITREGEQTWL
jgi:hypothetical protein